MIDKYNKYRQKIDLFCYSLFLIVRVTPNKKKKKEKPLNSRNEKNDLSNKRELFASGSANGQTLLGVFRQRGRRLQRPVGLAVQVPRHRQMGPQVVSAALDRRETAGQ